MRPAEQQHLYAQQQQQQHQNGYQNGHQNALLQQPQQHQQQRQLNSAYSHQFQQQQHQQQRQQQQSSSSSAAPFLAPHYVAQLAALNGLQVLGGMPMGGGGGSSSGGPMSGMHRGMLSVPQNGLLQQQQLQQWAQLRPESQAWGAGVYPSAQQGLIQASLVQQHVQQQQQVAHLQDLRSGSLGLNGVPLSQVHQADALRGGQQWAHPPHDGTGQQYGAAAPSLPRNPLRSQDGMRPAEFPRGGSHGGGHMHGNGNYHNKPYDRNNRAAGNWSRGGGGPNPRFKGGNFEKGRAEELVRSQSQAGALRCEACDRTFKNAQQFSAHNNTHVKCDVEGCSFEASGRVVKDHKQSAHDNSASDPQVRSKFKSKENEEEISRWIEERRKHYPTAANIKQKAEEMKARKMRGELVDEDARKRRERLKEILAKQAELGVPVAEVPSYYMSDRYGSLKGKGAKGESSESGANEIQKNGKRGPDRGQVSNGAAKEEEDKEPPTKVPRILDGSSHGSAEPAPRVPKLELDTIQGAKRVVVEVKEDLETEAVEQPCGLPTDEKDHNVPSKTSEKLCFFFKRGRCKKGNRCEFLHERRPKKKRKDDDVISAATQPAPKRAPTLLSKLLESDIRREKSHLLQSFRFFVNNMFLLEYPEKPLQFFEWQESPDRTSDAEVGRPDTENVLETGDGDGTDSEEEDMQTTSLAQEDSGELTRLEGEAEDVDFETLEGMSHGDYHDLEYDGVGTDEDMDTLHEEETRSEVDTRSDDEFDF
ncbi:unnamed protein product [Calypogeia fissa]